MHIIYYGSPGSYTHQATKNILAELGIQAKSIKPYPAVQELRANISSDTYAILPIENSYAGSVHAHLYQFLNYDYSIQYEYIMPIHHCLMSTHDDLKQIQHVYSHQQALDQCHDFCQSHKIISHSYIDTAAAAEHISKQQKTGWGAIGSPIAAALYGLNILATNIQDNEHNRTRFLLVGPHSTEIESMSSQAKKHILLLSVKNKPGILYSCLGVLAEHNIDMTKIESLPSKQDPFSYMFWIECLGEKDDISTMREALREYTTEVRVLGSV